MGDQETVNIARCPEHGLHGERSIGTRAGSAHLRKAIAGVEAILDASIADAVAAFPIAGDRS